MDVRKFLDAKLVTCQDHVKNLTGLALNLEWLPPVARIANPVS
jgi:hypothetical protein